VPLARVVETEEEEQRQKEELRRLETRKKMSADCCFVSRLNDNIISSSVYPSNISTCAKIASCYSNGSDSPHRRGVTPLLRAIGCIQQQDCVRPLSNGCQYMSPKVPLPVSDLGRSLSNTWFIRPT